MGDLADGRRLEEVIRNHKPSAVLHFAAYADVGESVEAPARGYRNNVVGTLALSEAICACGVDRMVFSSSCAVYGATEWILIREDYPENPI